MRHASAPPRRLAPSRRFAIAGGAAVIGTALTSIGLTQRTLWLDESATITASTFSLAQLHSLTERIDLVHAAYYVLMHVWFAIVGYSPFTLRFTSAIAVGFAAGLIVLLGARLFTLGVGTVAAVVFLMLPVTAIAGTTGRSQGLEIMLAVGATLILVHAFDATTGSPSRLRTVLLWAGYGLVVYIGVLTFLWFALLIAAHAMTVLLLVLRAPKQRWPALLAGVVTVLVVAVAVLPFARAAQEQADQVGWLTTPTLPDTFELAFRSQFFGLQLVTSSPPALATTLAVIAWTLTAIAVIVGVMRRSAGVAVLLPWLLLPTLVLLAASWYIKPVYIEHYVAFSAPAIALLIAGGLVALAPLFRGALSITLFAAILVTAGHIWVDERWGTSSATDFRSAAIAIAHTRTENDDPAGLLLGKMHRPADQLTIDYPAAVNGLQLLAIAKAAADKPYFFADLRSPSDQAAMTGSLRTVFYVGDDPTERSTVQADLQQRGFHARIVLNHPDVFVIRFTR